jgi:GntR family transcriptional regulator, carbon starvation induced regulator
MELVQANGSTLVERVVLLIQRDILTGVLKPAARLRVLDLARRYEIGATPIREALSRLGALGLVHAIGNRGFHVNAMSKEDLEDITHAREVIEADALRLAIERGDRQWEANIVAALYRLRKATAPTGGKGLEGQDEFDQAHKNFHSALIAACGSPRLLELHSILYDQAFRYRLIVMRKARYKPGFGDEHAQLADKVLKRKVAGATQHLTRHLHSTLRAVYPDE